jgi:hypothetical protein
VVAGDGDWTEAEAALRNDLGEWFVPVAFGDLGALDDSSEPTPGAALVVRAGDDLELAAARVSRALEARKAFS